MNLTPILQQEIEHFASNQGISLEQFIIQTLTEKINVLKQHIQPSVNPVEGTLREQDGLLVFDTEPLDQIDFNAMIDQNRDRSWETLGL
jgi:hypothetical protein